ncbi:MAG: DUF1700 domain-containing protein [Clostridia bacterium]|nr:DUF1700 domain-containing protein [Clostridia bacterium]
MKANEWIEILEKGLGPLPKDERDGVISYYKEMIADGLECGADEEEFVFTLGNPVDVANKILADNGEKIFSKNDGDCAYENADTQSPTQNDGAWIRGLIAIPLYALTYTLLIILGSLIFAGGATVLAGVIALPFSIVEWASGTVINGAGLFGISLSALGVGLALLIGSIMAFKSATKLNGKINSWIKGERKA